MSKAAIGLTVMNEPNWRTIPELIDASAQTYGPLQALVDGEVNWSFLELREAIYQAAKALISSGIKSGDKIAIWAPNTWEWICLLYTSPSPRDVEESRMPSSA